MNKEEIYDKEISPMMKQLIEICKENGIAMCMSFAIPTPEDDSLQCTTSIPDESGKLPDHMRSAVAELYRDRTSHTLQITTEKADGSKVLETFFS